MDVDIQALCRLCAKHYDHSIDVLLKSDIPNSFTNLIQEFFSVIIQAHDGLPSRICLPCKNRLETWERIREDVAQAQEYLTQCMLQQTGIHQGVVSGPPVLHSDSQLLQAPGPSLVDSNTHWCVDQAISADQNPGSSDEETPLHPSVIGSSLAHPTEPSWEVPPPLTEAVSSESPDIKTEEKCKKKQDEFRCNICSKKFARKDNLRQHLIIHSGNKSFCCDKCPQSFSRSSDLKVHYRIHTSEKPLQCHFCSQLFRESSNFRKHLRTHSGDRPFKCDICNKHFAQSPHLKRHLRVHSGERPYQCQVCSRQFSQSSTLRMHERTHSGAKPHTCSICSRSFRHASTLKAHTRTHTGEKAFYCDKCPKSFFWRTSFDCHILTHSVKNVV